MIVKAEINEIRSTDKIPSSLSGNGLSERTSLRNVHWHPCLSPIHDPTQVFQPVLPFSTKARTRRVRRCWIMYRTFRAAPFSNMFDLLAGSPANFASGESWRHAVVSCGYFSFVTRDDTYIFLLLPVFVHIRRDPTSVKTPLVQAERCRKLLERMVWKVSWLFPLRLGFVIPAAFHPGRLSLSLESTSVDHCCAGNNMKVQEASSVMKGVRWLGVLHVEKGSYQVAFSWVFPPSLRDWRLLDANSSCGHQNQCLALRRHAKQHTFHHRPTAGLVSPALPRWYLGTQCRYEVRQWAPIHWIPVCYVWVTFSMAHYVHDLGSAHLGCVPMAESKVDTLHHGCSWSTRWSQGDVLASPKVNFKCSQFCRVLC